MEEGKWHRKTKDDPAQMSTEAKTTRSKWAHLMGPTEDLGFGGSRDAEDKIYWFNICMFPN